MPSPGNISAGKLWGLNCRRVMMAPVSGLQKLLFGRKKQPNFVDFIGLMAFGYCRKVLVSRD
jgi:hypothetical protein